MGNFECVVGGLLPNTLYKFRSRIEQVTTVSVISTELEVVTAPSSPLDPVVVWKSQNLVKLVWRHGVKGADKYIIEGK